MTTPDRRHKLLDGIDIGNARGLEIGALCNPIVTRSEGEVYYVDYADTEFLRKRYATDPGVEVDRIVDVDFVWGARGLKEITGGRRFDYIVASHVIEHVPDLITWLTELHSVLAPGGSIRLAVPDRRYTFDYLRGETRICDVLAAFAQGARRPLPNALIDHVMHVCSIDPVLAWEGRIDVAAIRHPHTVQDALDVARDSLDNHTYHDVHCWVFTPASFTDLMAQLASLGLANLACSSISPTARNQIEFFVALQACADADAARESWRAAKARVLASESAEHAAVAAVRDAMAASKAAQAQDMVVAPAAAPGQARRLASRLRRLLPPAGASGGSP
jgi:SAM-dependent methyltransferase